MHFPKQYLMSEVSGLLKKQTNKQNIHFSFLYSAASYGYFQHCAQHPPLSAADSSSSPHPSDR